MKSLLLRVRRRLILWLAQDSIITFSGFSNTEYNGEFVQLPKA